ncbi:CPBP family intramembrane glutamic endopeptidase [Paenibacillus sinopodophylli]|uniref:CPBP family intramembrane glutamic endopeptidase n=1 Tax=Paenibacillus sinopodophylli TaxID=1837342 RepID=UPI001486590E|nr:type II CAAX endopeptidase family protein [Paenibacillus sinopodophylli]
MIDSIKLNEWKRFLWAAVACFIVFAVVEVGPMFYSMMTGELNTKVIDKETAENRATVFAEKQSGLQVGSAKAVHQTDKIMNGYLSKNDLIKTYTDKYDQSFPTDTYQVDLKFDSGETGYVYVHMQSEKIVAWNFLLNYQTLSGPDLEKEVAVFLPSQSLDANAFKQKSFEVNKGWHGEAPTGYTIEEAVLGVDINAQNINDRNIIVKYKPAFIAPSDYIQYVKKQDKLAGFLTGFGYMFMSFVLFVLAIIYAVLYRKFTSFKFGIILTIVYFITYIIMNLNILDGIRASLGETELAGQTVIFTAVFTLLLTIPMAGSIYISMIAGDGLWKAQGRALWPRFGQKGYGDHVWRSVGLAYLFAIILFATQSVIFIGLKLTIGTWDTTDATQSPYNMGVLWLMPVLAWAAAISEEAVFRFFGIGLFRRWFKNTFAAALLPTLFWALGHVMYPFYPSTTRLIELMIIGLMFSFIFVRYGFITAMFTHAIFNSVAVGLSLLTIGTAPNIISAIFFTVLPVIIAFVLKYFSSKKEKKPPVRATPPLEQL